MRINSETPTARFDTFLGAINNPQLLAIIFEVVRPPPKTRRNFQDRLRRQESTNAWKNGTEPLRRRRSPRRGPFLPCIFPIVFHSMARVGARINELMRFKSKSWLGAESNRRRISGCFSLVISGHFP